MSEDEQDRRQQQQQSTKSSASATSRPNVILPPRNFAESFFSSSSGRDSGSGFSPGPMTLLSSIFSDSNDCKSFSQLLAGAMTSPNNKPSPTPTDQKASSADWSLTISPPHPPPMFIMPSGQLDSPGLGFFSHQGPFGMSHQQVLAQVTAQAAQAQPHTHTGGGLSSLSPAQYASSAPSSMPHLQPLTKLEEEARDSSDFSQSDHRRVVVDDKPANDGYNWRKYGQKHVKGSEFPRSYYKCTHPSCAVKKKIERSPDGQVTEIIYKGQHNHQPPKSNKRAKDIGGVNGSQGSFELVPPFQGGNANILNDRKDQESTQASVEHLSGTSNGEEVGDNETGIADDDEDRPDPKRRSIEGRVGEPAPSHKTVTEPRIIVQTTSEVDLLDDGYRWRKYGQKVVKGNPYPRSYYKCTSQGCNVRKHVERAAADPKAVITTYEGKHNHDVPAAKGRTHNTANTDAT